MKIYVVVQHSERSAYIARQVRRWVRRSFCLADFLCTAVIGAAVATALAAGCMADGMDELLFLKLMLGCTVVGGIAVMLKAAIGPELRKRPGRRMNRAA